MLHVPSAELSSNLAYIAAALAMVLGLRTAEMPVKQSLLIHGSRAFRLAKVGRGDIEFGPCTVASSIVSMTVLFLAIIHAWVFEWNISSLFGGGIGGNVSCVYSHICTETPATMSPSVGGSSDKCSKCGTIKKSGTRSCCARDGAWFKNCGDAGDKNFGHTWLEGIQTCKSKLCRV